VCRALLGELNRDLPTGDSVLGGFLGRGFGTILAKWPDPDVAGFVFSCASGRSER